MPAPLELAAFCQNEYRPLIGMLTLYTGDPEVARDLAQEALIRLCANWRRVRRMDAPGPWLHRVAINLANSYFRRTLAERRASHRLQARADRPVVAAIDPSAAGAVRAALAALPPRQRTAVVLRYFLDLDVYDTARRMECGEGTVKKLTQRALLALRRDPRLEAGWRRPMSPDLRHLLDTGAGEPRDLLDFDLVWRRARRLVWRRRAVRAVVVVTLVIVGVAFVPTLPLPQNPDLPPTQEPPGRPLEPGPLAPERYRVPGFSPPLILDVHVAGWTAELVRPPTWILLDRAGVNLHLQRWQTVYDPVADPPSQRPLPGDLTTWLQTHPRLHVTSSTPIAVGGMPGRQLDLTVTTPLRQRPQECSRPCALLGRVAGYREPIDLDAGAQARFVILDTSPGQLVISFRTPPQQFDQVAQQVARLLSGLRFETP